MFSKNTGRLRKNGRTESGFSVSSEIRSSLSVQQHPSHDELSHRSNSLSACLRAKKLSTEKSGYAASDPLSFAMLSAYPWTGLSRISPSVSLSMTFSVRISLERVSCKAFVSIVISFIAATAHGMDMRSRNRVQILNTYQNIYNHP